MRKLKNCWRCNVGEWKEFHVCEIFGNKPSRKGVNRGSQNPQAKLDEAKVKEIRRLAKVPYYLSPKDLSKKFKVSTITINQIINKTSWSHVD